MMSFPLSGERKILPALVGLRRRSLEFFAFSRLGNRTPLARSFRHPAEQQGKFHAVCHRPARA